MRECWVNVYASATEAFCGGPHETRGAAEATAFLVPNVVYHLHVRLKPEWREMSPPGLWRGLVAR